MSDADRLRMMIHNGYMQAIREDDGDIEAHICRAIVEEFGLTRECLCDDWSPNCDHCIKKLILGWAILDVAEADDD